MSKRQRSSQAQAAAMIRKHLKQAYPHTKFTVRSSSFAGGDAVDVSWTDGPTTAEVDEFTDQFQYGDFNGMIDLYEYTNRRDDIPQVKYVQTQRCTSRDAASAIVAQLNERRGRNLQIVDTQYGGYSYENDEYTGNGWQSQKIWPEFSKRSLVCPDCKATTLPDDRFCPECGDPLPVNCWMCDTPTPARAITTIHDRPFCLGCYLTEVELKTT